MPRARAGVRRARRSRARPAGIAPRRRRHRERARARVRPTVDRPQLRCACTAARWSASTADGTFSSGRRPRRARGSPCPCPRNAPLSGTRQRRTRASSARRGATSRARRGVDGQRAREARRDVRLLRRRAVVSAREQRGRLRRAREDGSCRRRDARLPAAPARGARDMRADAGESPGAAQGVALAGAVAAVTLHGWLGYAAIPVLAALAGMRALARGPVLVPIAAAVIGATGGRARRVLRGRQVRPRRRSVRRRAGVRRGGPDEGRDRALSRAAPAAARRPADPQSGCEGRLGGAHWPRRRRSGGRRSPPVTAGAGGKSELHRARCRVTPGGGNAEESATERKPPSAPPHGGSDGKGERAG